MSRPMTSYEYVHCDVFTSRPYGGNSLAVFPDAHGLSAEQMQTITKELRHFESIFLFPGKDGVQARVFDLFEELPFAGHPIVGAACTLHRQSNAAGRAVQRFSLQGGRTVSVETERTGDSYSGTLDQGSPKMIGALPEAEKPGIAAAFNLLPDQIANLPAEVISTGLEYLVVPVAGGLGKAGITVPDLEQRLAAFGASFAYLFDITRLEGRHWNNDGIVEDAATGSAAGVVGAYAVKHGLVQPGQTFTLRQGHFMNRPSEIRVTGFGTPDGIDNVTVAGDVAFVGTGKVVAP